MKALAFAALVMPACGAFGQQVGNLFNDPFVQVTAGLPGCPVPRGPYITEEKARVQQHVRSQHGNSCYRSGRCRLPNSYLYDAELVPRVQTFIRADGRFNDTSLWIVGERRIVTVMGCVRTQEQAIALERAITLVDDVSNVIPYVMVGTQGAPPYKVVGDTQPD
ncbi:BON domain-containing protein [Ramlibacter sp. PS4R-6]|uniref:BON domain-containing protein n=1 Tax=Ramlibacter sp. PS4R-6 TaxID=3133438 RepID=UPI0030A02DAB